MILTNLARDGREKLSKLGHGGGSVPVAVKIRFNQKERERETKNSIEFATSRFLLLFLLFSLPSCCTIARQRLAARRGEDTCSTRQGGFTIE